MGDYAAAGRPAGRSASFGQVLRKLAPTGLPLLLVMFIGVMLITYFPLLTTALLP